MNIVYDHQIFYDQQFGGISRYFYELATGLTRRKDFSISVVAPFHINEYLQHFDHSLENSSYFKRQFYGAARVRHWGRKLLLPMYYALHANADIVHETYYSMNPIGRGRYRVLTIYDMIHELFPDQFRDDLITSKAKVMAIARADHVICISESTRQDLVRMLGVNPNKTSVVHLGPSLIGCRIKQPIANVSAIKPYLLYVGNRDRYKNFSSLCLAFAGSKVLRENFKIVAFGGVGFYDTEKTIFNKLGIADQVCHVIGGDDLLKAYYCSASLFVYPSLYEGFGIPPLEAMSYGCPVVCSNTSSIPEVVGDAGIYFDPYSVDSIRDAMERVMGSADLRAELFVKGRERLKKFSWEKCVYETANVYKSVAGYC